MRHAAKRGDRLTVREAAVCDLMSAGMTCKEIARQLNISYRTVEDHRSRVMVKRGAKNAADLVRIVLTEQFTKLNGGPR